MKLSKETNLTPEELMYLPDRTVKRMLTILDAKREWYETKLYGGGKKYTDEITSHSVRLLLENVLRF
tara:strand:- start:197 stop:397 length:201 start_codon:yes stop_codon:yes gene_type:complete